MFDHRDVKVDPELQYSYFEKWWKENNFHFDSQSFKSLAYKTWVAAIKNVNCLQEQEDLDDPDFD